MSRESLSKFLNANRDHLLPIFDPFTHLDSLWHIWLQHSVEAGLSDAPRHKSFIMFANQNDLKSDRGQDDVRWTRQMRGAHARKS